MCAYTASMCARRAQKIYLNYNIMYIYIPFD